MCKAADNTASTAARAAPFIGLLLPLGNAEFASQAKAVAQGCEAALALIPERPALKVLASDATPARVLSEYRAAVADRAAVIVGPMTRSGVSALVSSASVDVPTLALNAPEQAGKLPPLMETMGLTIEPEARAVARAAFAQGLRDAVIFEERGAFATRSARAFTSQWLELGGWVSAAEPIAADTDLKLLAERMARSQADLVFLAADADHARLVIPYAVKPVFATSQINDGRTDAGANIELNGVRFVDMPWLLQPDHPAVMIYPRESSLSIELQRFYALGIDACRAANERLRDSGPLHLDGVIGDLLLRAGRPAERNPMQAVFRDGVAVALEPRP